MWWTFKGTSLMAQNLGSRWLDDSLPTLWTPSSCNPDLDLQSFQTVEVAMSSLVSALFCNLAQAEKMENSLAETNQTWRNGWNWICETNQDPFLSVFFGGCNQSWQSERQFGVFALFVFMLRSTWLDVRMKILGQFWIYIYISQKVFGILGILYSEG